MTDHVKLEAAARAMYAWVDPGPPDLKQLAVRLADLRAALEAEPTQVVIDVPGCGCRMRSQAQLDRADVCPACVSYFDLEPMPTQDPRAPWDRVSKMTGKPIPMPTQDSGPGDVGETAWSRRFRAADEHCQEYPSPPGEDAMDLWRGIEDKPHKGPRYIQEALAQAHAAGQAEVEAERYVVWSEARSVGRAEMAAEVRELLPSMALRSPTPAGRALLDLLAKRPEAE